MLDLSHVRSLTVYGEWKPYFISEKMRFLRVLDLENTLWFVGHHLDEIGQLHHLRYLSLRNCTYIWYLPNSIGNLSHLQTLDITGTSIFELPTAIAKLRKLQHLLTADEFFNWGKADDVFFGYYKSMCKYSRDSRDYGGKACSCRCWQIQGMMCIARATLLRTLVRLIWIAQRSELGLNTHDIFNLHRSLWVCLHSEGMDGVKAPRGTGKLLSLETLGVISISRGEGKILKELSALAQLGKLGVTGINEGNQKKFWSAIAAHNQLHSLTVYHICGQDDYIDGCLDGDLLPPKHLQSLKLVGPLGKVQDWMHHLQSLSKLDLEGSKLKEADDIQTIGDLPNLTVLRLRSDAIEMEQLHFLGPSFPSLMVLVLSSFLGLLTFTKGTMPRLELVTCVGREMKGLHFLTKLKEIRMSNYYINEMKIELQKQYAEHPNLKNVSLKLRS